MDTLSFFFCVFYLLAGLVTVRSVYVPWEMKQYEPASILVVMFWPIFAILYLAHNK